MLFLRQKDFLARMVYLITQYQTMALPLHRMNSNAAKVIKRHRTRPLQPQAKGQIERIMPSLNKASQTAFLERKDQKLELHKFLFYFRNCPHTVTKIPNKINIVKINNELEKSISVSLQIGDRVTVKQRKLNKLTPILKPAPYRVIDIKGTLIKAEAKKQRSRSYKNLRIIPKDAVFPNSTCDKSDDGFEYSRNNNNDNHNQNNRR